MTNVPENQSIDIICALAAKQYPLKNSGGEGFSVGDEGDSISEAVSREGWELLHESRESDGLAIAKKPSGDLVAIGDAEGPWGVDLGFIEYTGADQNWNDAETVYWFNADGDKFGLVESDGPNKVVDSDGCPVSDEARCYLPTQSGSTLLVDVLSEAVTDDIRNDAAGWG